MSKTLKMYSVFDSKVGAYDRPFFLRSRGEALRSWQAIANDTSSAICAHPEDFSLFELGEFDVDTATFTPHRAPESLGVAVEFQAKRNTDSNSMQGARN